MDEEQSRSEFRSPGCSGTPCNIRQMRAASIERIVQLEWEFFQDVNNVGGRASCQDMPWTFSVMRESQFCIWTEDMLLSYLGDLRAAQDEGRNPLTEKYAYMMRSTHPDEFARIEDALPIVGAEKSMLIERIVAIQIVWAEELAARYPHFTGRGRAIHTADDTQDITSLETYSRGELSTYSEQTLRLMLAHFEEAFDAGTNLQIDVDDRIARSYGYNGLDAAEAALAQKAADHATE